MSKRAEYDEEVRRLVESEEAEHAFFEMELGREGIPLCKFDRDIPCFGARSNKQDVGGERCRVAWSDKHGHSVVYYCEFVRFLGGVGFGMTIREKVLRQKLFENGKGGDKHE